MYRLRIPLPQFMRVIGTLLALFMALPSFAQTTGEIRGNVVDEDDLSIPGVEITLTGEALIGGSQSRTSNASGIFQFVQLPPGVYELIAEKDGFGTVGMSNIQVQVGRSATPTVPMEYGDATVIEIVDTPPAVDVTSTTRGSHA
jgi:hypothetical protein